MAVGKVYLVGAGCGDAQLLTIKGKNLIEKADVIVYDALVGEGVLSLVDSSKKVINVGKRSSNHTMVQEDINKVLLEEAQKGNIVVRLKGGDPFLFGRGGEELELLAENNIPFEVVPGVTSSIAVPAYNGIPVTHRDFCSSLHIITGHAKKGAPLKIDFESLVKVNGTLVFLMGVSSLNAICNGLIENGMDINMPAAILSKGTTSRQKRIVATVSTLANEVEKKGIATPAIIVVGKVCWLSDKFHWFEKLPLFGYKVVVTRPKNLKSTITSKLREKGAEVIEFSAITTDKLEENKFSSIKEKASTYNWVILTSPTGVDMFFENLIDNQMDIRAFSNAKFAVVGDGTKKALAKKGIIADFVPTTFDGESLATQLAQNGVKGENILLPRAKQGGSEIVKILTQNGNVVDDIATYQTNYAKDSLVTQTTAFTKENIDCLVFTSSSSVDGFVNATENINYSELTCACIGKQTKATADSYGFKTKMAAKATIDSLVDLVVEMKNEG